MNRYNGSGMIETHSSFKKILRCVYSHQQTALLQVLNQIFRPLPSYDPDNCNFGAKVTMVITMQLMALKEI